MTRNHREGSAAEHVVAAFFLRKGYDVLWPAAEGGKYDLMVHKTGYFLKVQVKKATRSRGRLRVKCTPNGGRNRLIYRAGDFDILAAVDRQRIWLIPYRSIARRGTLPLDTEATNEWLQKG